MKRIYSFVLCLLLLTVTLLSCEFATPLPDETVSDDSTSNSTDVLWLVKDGKSEYRVVISETAPKYVRPQATVLIAQIQEATGVKLPLVMDDSEATGKEILIGDTNRLESLSALGTQDIYVAVKNSNIVIKGGCEAVFSDAMDKFLNAIKREGKNMSLLKDFMVKETVDTINNTSKELVASLKVGTYNIHYGSDVFQNYQPIAQDILDNQLDVVGLQEVYKNTNGSNGQDATFLIAQYTEYRYCFYAPAHLEPGGGEYGNAIVSKYPIVSAGYEILPTENIKSELRCVMWADIDVNGVQVRFFNTHLSYYVGETELQLRRIGELVPKDRPWILSGDFNYSKFNIFSHIFEDVTMVNTEKNPIVTIVGEGAIDNLVFSSDVKFTSYEVRDTKHSDHYLMIATVEIYG